MRIEIFVTGIDDQALAGAVELAIRGVFRDLSWPGGWRITVSQSHIGGRWDLSVKGPAGRHLLSLTVPAELLPDLIPRRLRESLLDAVSSVSSSAVGGSCGRAARADRQPEEELVCAARTTPSSGARARGDRAPALS
jgi:hypothetical protein